MTRGEALVFAAWISVFGGYLVPRVLSLFTSNLDTLATITGIGLGLGVVGAIFLVVLIWWVEGKVLERRRSQLAETATPVDHAPAPPASVDAIAGAAPGRHARRLRPPRSARPVGDVGLRGHRVVRRGFVPAAADRRPAADGRGGAGDEASARDGACCRPDRRGHPGAGPGGATGPRRAGAGPSA